MEKLEAGHIYWKKTSSIGKKASNNQQRQTQDPTEQIVIINEL